MGIPSYFRKITNQHANIIKSKIPRCDRLFFDFNGIIHNCCAKLRNTVDMNLSKSEFEAQLMNDIKDYTLEIIGIVKPTKLVYLCIDGVAPLSKIKQQRTRRYLSVFINNELPNNGYVWDTNAISPGTPFMIRLNEYLHKAFTNKHVSFETIISDSSEKGEGEHKIFDYINEKKADYNDIVYGLDADLIMLSLISKNQKIHLLREDVHFHHKRNTNHEQNNTLLVLDVHTLRINLLNYFDNKIDIYSYVCLCFLVGNDFLPCLSYINIHNNGLETLTNAYVKVNELTEMSLIHKNNEDNFELNDLFFGKLLEILQKCEDVEFKREHDKYYNNATSYKTKKLRLDNYGTVNKNISFKDMFSEPNWRSYYYKHLFDSNIGTNTIMKASESYMNGMKWNVGYYFNKKYTQKWFYTHNYSPTILDVLNYVTSMGSCEHHTTGDPYDPKNDIDIKPDEQLLMILPPQSLLTIMSNEYNGLLQIDSKVCHMYPFKFDIMTYQKSKLHTCFPILPNLDYKLIKEYVTQVET